MRLPLLPWLLRRIATSASCVAFVGAAEIVGVAVDVIVVVSLVISASVYTAGGAANVADAVAVIVIATQCYCYCY